MFSGALVYSTKIGQKIARVSIFRRVKHCAQTLPLALPQESYRSSGNLCVCVFFSKMNYRSLGLLALAVVKRKLIREYVRPFLIATDPNKSKEHKITDVTAPV